MSDRLRGTRPVAWMALAFFAAASSAAARAQQAASAPAQPPAPAAQHVNVQVLKDLSDAQLHDAMVFISASLGANCGFCHVRSAQGGFAFDKDDKPEKKRARQMLQMTRGIDAQYFEDKPSVTCASCHQGRQHPNPQPPFAQPPAAEQGPMTMAHDEGQRPPAPSETVDQVVARYVQAAGGEERLRKITTVVMRGTVTNQADEPSPVLVEEAAPDRYRSTADSKPPVSLGYDGAAAWLATGGNARDLHGVELAYAARLGDLGLPLRLKDTYAGLAVGRYDRVGGHDVISLNGRPSPAVMETLDFERGSGLLLRRVVRLQTPLGRLPLQIDYGDYREVDGVKVPFEVRITDWSNAKTEKFTEVKLNAAIDDSRFTRPR